MQGGGEHGGVCGGHRRWRRGGADVHGAMRHLPGLRVRAQQPLHHSAVHLWPRDAARRHHPILGCPGKPPARPGLRVQLQRVHRRGCHPGRQNRPRCAAQDRLPPRLRSQHR